MSAFKKLTKRKHTIEQAMDQDDSDPEQTDQKRLKTDPLPSSDDSSDE
jgi:hypothetical protein